MRFEVSRILAGAVNGLSTRRIWEELRIQGPKVSWHNLVWFPGRIPEQSTILWMIILDMLPTRTRLLRMGLNIDTDNFAKELWGNVFSLCGIMRNVSTWDRELEWATKLLKGKSLIVRILKLALAGHVYALWCERNSILFGDRARLVGDVLNDIRDTIQIRLNNWSICKSNSRNIALCEKWGI
ncbi:uncharacterized protein LOC120181295 [Hibiscus syriacus]|uniref:uncharacterized protein LOC120181295 n=1 Tax=Hibiscus syriacus TaxID=106335 RepID=UPI00192328D6|nr:uncharacterized protein LOC120181295 [Hibiscus syriacus]